VLKLTVNAARLLLALTFILSGFVKAVDPTGTAYKINDYLTAWGVISQEHNTAAIIVAAALAALEFSCGILLLFAIRRRLTSRVVLLFMTVMTAITAWTAITDGVSDCGCFGDAVKLTNTQTLLKNIVLLAAAGIVAYKPLLMTRFISRTNQWIVINYTLLFIIIVEGISLYKLPLMDFRPYRIGANLPEGMQIPEGEQGPKFETTFLMEKDGQRKEFTLENYPDSTWTFIDSKTVQTEKGYTPPIHDFAINLGDDDITEEVLSDTGYTFLLIAPHLETADDTHLDDINRIYEYAQDNNYPFYCLTASGQEAIDRWADITGAEYPFATTDETTLKTMIRSNPGLMLLKNGTVANKWSHTDLPEEDELNGRLEKLPVGEISTEPVRTTATKTVMWFIIPLLLLTIADRMWAWSTWIRKKEKENRIVKRLKRKRNMRKKIVAGNWKMNLNLQEGIALAKELNEALKADQPQCGVIICTPFIHLASVAQTIDQQVIGLGAENCADKEKGAFTGEVSAEMVKSTGAQYVILGHSERREYYNETPEILKEKVLLALKNNLKVIFCIGETLQQREEGKQNDVVKAELEGSVFNLTAEEFKNIIIAYEPIWAIGTGKTATSDQAEEIHAFIRSIIADKYGKETAEDTTILYGGSCKPSNAPELFAKPDIDGGLIGGASLKAADFKGIIDAWKK